MHLVEAKFREPKGEGDVLMNVRDRINPISHGQVLEWGVKNHIWSADNQRDDCENQDQGPCATLPVSCQLGPTRAGNNLIWYITFEALPLFSLRATQLGSRVAC
jgi:hypothetical protein